MVSESTVGIIAQRAAEAIGVQCHRYELDFERKILSVELTKPEQAISHSECEAVGRQINLQLGIDSVELRVTVSSRDSTIIDQPNEHIGNRVMITLNNRKKLFGRILSTDDLMLVFEQRPGKKTTYLHKDILTIERTPGRPT